jgi:hypothetical protein
VTYHGRGGNFNKNSFHPSKRSSVRPKTQPSHPLPTPQFDFDLSFPLFCSLVSKLPKKTIREELPPPNGRQCLAAEGAPRWVISGLVLPNGCTTPDREDLHTHHTPGAARRRTLVYFCRPAGPRSAQSAGPSQASAAPPYPRGGLTTSGRTPHTRVAGRTHPEEAGRTRSARLGVAARAGAPRSTRGGSASCFHRTRCCAYIIGAPSQSDLWEEKWGLGKARRQTQDRVAAPSLEAAGGCPGSVDASVRGSQSDQEPGRVT